MTAAVLLRPHPWLAPLGTLFGGAVTLRARLYGRGLLPRARLQAPVISIGNLAVGGRGKTPLVQWVAALLRDSGQQVAVLSRGYGGSFRGDALVVSDGRGEAVSADVAGDEPVMLSRALPGVIVAVGRDRVRAGRAVEQRLRPAVHVLDDGFQHLRLARDLDVVCLDADDLQARLLPAGVLREPVSALERAHLIAVSGNDDAAVERAITAVRSRFPRALVFGMRRRPLGWTDRDGAPAAAPGRAYLLSGIARPERFAADVTQQGVTVAGHAAFADHHRFRPSDVEDVWARARAAAADVVVTTAKDAVRMPAEPGGPPLLVFRMECAVADDGPVRARVRAAAAGAR